MIIFLIVGIVLGGLSVIFALQNVEIITVSFFSWSLSGSLAVILLLAITTGIVITSLFLLPKSISNYLKYRSTKKENESLKIELEKQKERTVFAKHEQPTQEVLSSIEHGAIDGGNEI